MAASSRFWYERPNGADACPLVIGRGTIVRDATSAMTAATIIDGRALGQRIKNEAAHHVRELKGQGVSVRLDAVMVGDPAAGEIYARSQGKLL